jgi:PHP family Zn ribbon phosphoesterase
MSPANIVSEAVRKELDIIGITDHNSTRQAGLVRMLGARKGLFVLQGAEVTTREEVHCLVFFDNPAEIELLQEYLDDNIPAIKNVPLIFGDQVVVNENEDIIYTEEKLLINATGISIGALEKFIHAHGGLFIPAHIDREKNSIYSQLGFLPDGLNADALEISKLSSPEEFSRIHPEIKAYPLLTNSDSHYPEAVGDVFNCLEMEELTFGEIKMAIKGIDGRRIK